MKLSFAEVQLRRIEKKLSVTELRKAAGISKETWRNIRNEQDIWMDSAKSVADALAEKSLLAITHPSKLAELSGMYADRTAGAGLADWEPHTPQSGRIEASNGLKYWVWMLKQRFEKEKFARGKQYDLRPLPTKEQDRMIHYLTRHGDVCNLVGASSRFPQHMTTEPDDDGQAWWVIDEWTPGTTLADAIANERLEKDSVPRIMREIAEGLKTLHQAKVIRRALSPQTIILQDPDDSVVLTDFELGKLLDGSPTVSNGGPGNAYQADDVGGRRLTEEDTDVDLYSWARILLVCVMGELPLKGHESQCVERASVPPKVRDIVKRCLAVDPDNRPKRVDDVLKAIRSWK